MKQKDTFIDVNRDAYIKSLITDLTKQAHLSQLPDRAKTIYEYVMNNSSKKNDNGSLNIKDGYVTIHRIHRK